MSRRVHGLTYLILALAMFSVVRPTAATGKDGGEVWEPLAPQQYALTVTPHGARFVSWGKEGEKSSQALKHIPGGVIVKIFNNHSEAGYEASLEIRDIRHEHERVTLLSDAQTIEDSTWFGTLVLSVGSEQDGRELLLTDGGLGPIFVRQFSTNPVAPSSIPKDVEMGYLTLDVYPAHTELAVREYKYGGELGPILNADEEGVRSLTPQRESVRRTIRVPAGHVYLVSAAAEDFEGTEVRLADGDTRSIELKPLPRSDSFYESLGLQPAYQATRVSLSPGNATFQRWLKQNSITAWSGPDYWRITIDDSYLVAVWDLPNPGHNSVRYSVPQAGIYSGDVMVQLTTANGAVVTTYLLTGAGSGRAWVKPGVIVPPPPRPTPPPPPPPAPQPIRIR